MKRLRAVYLACFVASGLVAACGWNPSKPFDREAPEVREAIERYDAGEPKVAATTLEDYLGTGACAEGHIGTPPRVRERGNGSFDLGLAVFKIAESLGRRFGEEEVDAGPGAVDPSVGLQRGENVDCALQIVRLVAQDSSQPADLRARARYLEGNLLFLKGAYEDAVKAYDQALAIAPGMHDNGPSGTTDAGRPYTPDPVGRDAAFNRAIALRRIDDKKDAGKDAAPDAQGDSGGGDGGGDKGDGGGGKDGGSSPDGGGQSKSDEDSSGEKRAQQEPERRDAGAAVSASQDDRMLDQLENAPTVQQQAAKTHAKRHPVKGMADK